MSTPASPAAAAPSASPAQRQMIGYLLAGLGAFLFASKAIIIKLAYAQGIDTETLLALRMGLSTPVYLAVGVVAALAMTPERRAEALQPGLILRAGLVGLLGYWFSSYTDFLGLNYISAQFERLILFTYPLFTVLFGTLFFGQRVRPISLVAFVFSYAGLALIFFEEGGSAGSNVALGSGLVMAAAVTFALYQLLAKNLIGRLGSQLFTSVAMTGAAIAAIAQFLVMRPIGNLDISAHLWGLSVLLAIGATVLPTFFMSAALGRITAQANATIGTLSPIATILLAVAVLGETLNGTDLLGTALVFVGVGWFTLSERR